MLNRILSILFPCFAAMILTAGIAWGSPLPGGLLIADHTPDHSAAIAQPALESPQAETPSPVQPELTSNRTLNREDTPALQADPSVPYDPYDYEVIREMNREIYGEVKGEEKG